MDMYNSETVLEDTWVKNKKKILFTCREEGISYVSTLSGRIHRTGFISSQEELFKLENWLNS